MRLRARSDGVPCPFATRGRHERTVADHSSSRSGVQPHDGPALRGRCERRPGRDPFPSPWTHSTVRSRCASMDRRPRVRNPTRSPHGSGEPDSTVADIEQLLPPKALRRFACLHDEREQHRGSTRRDGGHGRQAAPGMGRQEPGGPGVLHAVEPTHQTREGQNGSVLTVHRRSARGSDRHHSPERPVRPAGHGRPGQVPRASGNRPRPPARRSARLEPCALLLRRAPSLARPVRQRTKSP